MGEDFSDSQCRVCEQGLHGEITIMENKSFRWLCHGDDVMHSCMSLERPEQLVLPYQQYMAGWQLFLPALSAGSVLLLGLGGGDSIRFLQHYYPGMFIRAIEQDPAIVRLACEWFALQPEAARLELLVEEAGDFMLRQHQHYDLILIDMLAGENMPTCLQDESFWGACCQSLSATGVVVINGIFANSDAFMLLMKQLQAVFAHLPLCMSVPDYKNVVLLVGRHALPTDMCALRQRADLLHADSGQDFSAVLEILPRDNPGVE